MKALNTIITTLLFTISSLCFGQQVSDLNKNNIVDRLNTPTKIWNNGKWEINQDGTKYWKKGYWKFEKKTFQQKSEIFRNKIRNRNKV